MKISCIKATNDDKNFKILRGFGVPVFDLDDLEHTDAKIKELVKKEYDTIIISAELAGNSSDIIKKYDNSKKINIIIYP